MRPWDRKGGGRGARLVRTAVRVALAIVFVLVDVWGEVSCATGEGEVGGGSCGVGRRPAGGVGVDDV
jgi:hypothetical protein